MKQKTINIYTVQELEKLNKNAFDEVLCKFKKEYKNLFIEETTILGEKIDRILKYFYFIAEFVSDTNGDYVTVTYQGDEEFDFFRVIQDLKDSLNSNNRAEYYVQEYLQKNPIEKNSSSVVCSYLEELFKDFQNKGKNHFYEYTTDNIIKFINDKNKLFTINGIDIDHL